ncbi:MAG TPA: MFS transporter [Xanthobacteraceae bacterium]|jgi:PPP family 3-phenylpropionic acid transporter
MGADRGYGGARPDLGPESPFPNLAAGGKPANGGRGGRLSLAGAFGVLFLAVGVYMPFFPLFLAARGLSPELIGIAIAIPMLVKLVVLPPAGWLWDRIDRPRAILAAIGLGAAGGFALVGFAPGTAAILIAVAISAMFWGPSFALIDAFAVRLQRVRAVDYGRARLWGSVSFVAGNLLAGAALDILPGASIVWLIATPFLLFSLTVWLLPVLPRAVPVPVGSTSAPGRIPMRFVLGILAVAIIDASHALFYTFSAVQWTAAGMSPGLIGFLWSAGVIAEIVLFIYAAQAVRRFRPMLLIVLGGIAAIVRFGAMAFEPAAGLLFVLQLLHALTFGATHIGMIALINESIPDRALGRAQASASTASGIAMALATLAAGPLFARYGAGAYLPFAALGAIGAGIALLASVVPGQAQRR